jgi:3-dehydroquinate synthase
VISPTLSIPGNPPSDLWVADLDPGWLETLAQEHDRVAVLADENVHRLHGSCLGTLQERATHLVPPGEACKSFDQLQAALEFCATTGLSRGSLLITLGGGATSDLGGLAAALFKRGLTVAHIPTTLVGQVDAAIGGKTAIDMHAGKNLVGAFHMPRAVFADVRLLRTLPPVELQAGLGEVVKCGLLGGKQALAQLEQDAADLVVGDPDALRRAVLLGAGLKVEIVKEDPREQGRRKLLNLGHTFAHAIETCAGHGTVPHGVAVAVGLQMALRASRAKKILTDQALPERLEKLLRALGLPSNLADLQLQKTPTTGDLWHAMAHDKKGAVGKPEFILLKDLGAAEWGVPLDQALVGELWNL